MGPWLLLLWKPIAIILVVGGLVGGIYYQGYTRGVESCEATYIKKENKRIDEVNKRIDDLAKQSANAAKDQEVYLGKVNGKVAIILADVKELAKKPTGLTTVPDCKPSKAFIGASNEIAKTANTTK